MLDCVWRVTRFEGAFIHKYWISLHVLAEECTKRLLIMHASCPGFNIFKDCVPVVGVTPPCFIWKKKWRKVCSLCLLTLVLLVLIPFYFLLISYKYVILWL